MEMNTFQQLLGFDGTGFPGIEVEANFSIHYNRLFSWLSRAKEETESDRNVGEFVEKVHAAVSEANGALKPAL